MTPFRSNRDGEHSAPLFGLFKDFQNPTKGVSYGYTQTGRVWSIRSAVQRGNGNLEMVLEMQDNFLLFGMRSRDEPMPLLQRLDLQQLPVLLLQSATEVPRYRKTEGTMNPDKLSKCLKVASFPQGSGYVPFIRIAGLWLRRFGFEMNETVRVSAEAGKITIEKIQPVNKEE